MQKLYLSFVHERKGNHESWQEGQLPQCGPAPVSMITKSVLVWTVSLSGIYRGKLEGLTLSVPKTWLILFGTCYSYRSIVIRQVREGGLILPAITAQLDDENSASQPFIQLRQKSLIGSKRGRGAQSDKYVNNSARWKDRSSHQQQISNISLGTFFIVLFPGN